MNNVRIFSRNPDVHALAQPRAITLAQSRFAQVPEPTLTQPRISRDQPRVVQQGPTRAQFRAAQTASTLDQPRGITQAQLGGTTPTQPRGTTQAQPGGTPQAQPQFVRIEGPPPTQIPAKYGHMYYHPSPCGNYVYIIYADLTGRIRGA